MSKTIWKHVLRIEDEQTIEIPEAAQFLCAHEQMGEVCVWFRCDPTYAPKKRTIIMRGTGHPLPDRNLTYLGSAVLHSGHLVFHVFEAL